MKKKKIVNKRVLFVLYIIILVAAGLLLTIYIFKTFATDKPAVSVVNFPEQDVSQTNTEIRKPEVGYLAPGFMTQNIYGDIYSLDDFIGDKPLLLIFWSTWCGTCLQELPDLKKITEIYGDKVNIVTINSFESGGAIRDYIEKKDVNFLMLTDGGKRVWNKYLNRGTPTHYMISRSGKIIKKSYGLASFQDLETMLTMVEYD